MNDIYTLVVSALLSVLASSFIAYVTTRIESPSYWRQARVDLQKEYDSRFNSKKWETYLGSNEIIQGIYYRKQEAEEDPINIEDKIRLLGTQILLIGSNDVIDAFVSWQKQRPHGDFLSGTLEKIHALVVEMRKDLGLKDNQFEIELIRGFTAHNRSGT